MNKTVRELNLESNNVSDEGTTALAEALKVSFVFFRELSAFSWLPPLPVTHPFLLRMCACSEWQQPHTLSRSGCETQC